MSNHKPSETAASDITQTAQLEWDAEGQPISSQFDDVYFSKENGLEETRYVFLHHNKLEERWTALPSGANFVIGETGFGTGLNFLAAWQLWQQTAPPNTHLHFISVEKYPVQADELGRALRLWPELESLATQLQQHYPRCLHQGFHRLNFATDALGRRVTLTLIINEAAEGFTQLLQSSHPGFDKPNRAVDAWFLDGFAPSKNPDMWSEQLFDQMAKLSHSKTTAATFTAAGVVKRGLKSRGFRIKKVDGFGHKRDMLIADSFDAECLSTAAVEHESVESSSRNSDYPPPWHIPTHAKQNTHPQTALVIGAGIAGSQIARKLAERGVQVTLLERHAKVAQEGSGNPQGVLYGKLSHRREILSDFNLLALQYAQRSYAPYWTNAQSDSETPAGKQCGVLQTAQNEKQHQQQKMIVDSLGSQQLVELLDAQAASEVAGVPLSHGGLFFRESGWLKPSALCEQWIEHEKIELKLGVEVDTLQPFDATESRWRALDKNGAMLAEADTVVICCAYSAKHLQQSADLPLKPVRGQVSYLPESEASKTLNTVLCGDGYIAPSNHNHHCFGATFDPKSQQTDTRDSDHQRNLETLSKQYPVWFAPLAHAVKAKQLKGRAALRCTTPDYLPLVGPLPIQKRFIEQFSLLGKNAKATIPCAGQHYPGLFVSVGYGSRGLAYSPLCSELLASQICGEPYPVDQALLTALHPGRFIIRNLIRNKI